MKMLKRSAVTVVGVGLLATGVALMVLPGPGILLIVAGLAVLATEYVWAQRLVVHAKDRAEKAQQQAVASPVRTGATVAFGLAMCALGVSMIVVEDVHWPVYDDRVDAFWSPLAGSVVIVTALILLTTTAMAVISGRGSGEGGGPGAEDPGGTGAGADDRRAPSNGG